MGIWIKLKCIFIGKPVQLAARLGHTNATDTSTPALNPLEPVIPGFGYNGRIPWTMNWADERNIRAITRNNLTSESSTAMIFKKQHMIYDTQCLKLCVGDMNEATNLW
jgi:hypothetical protein